MVASSSLFVQLLEHLLLLFFAWSGSAGAAIVILTVLLCALLLPLSVTSFYHPTAILFGRAHANWRFIRIASRLLLPFLVLLVFLSGLDQAVRNLTQPPDSELTSAAPGPPLASIRLASGALWIGDLGNADPYYILPVLAILVPALLAIPMLRHSRGALQRALALVLLVLLLVGVALSVTSSSGALLFWVCGNGIVLTLLYSYVMSLAQR